MGYEIPIFRMVRQIYPDSHSFLRVNEIDLAGGLTARFIQPNFRHLIKVPSLGYQLLQIPI